MSFLIFNFNYLKHFLNLHKSEICDRKDIFYFLQGLNFIRIDEKQKKSNKNNK